MESCMPNVEDVVAQNTVRIERVCLGDMPSGPRTLKLHTIKKGSSIEKRIYAEVYELADDRIRGYLPSKVWYRDPNVPVDEHFFGVFVHMVFYVSGAFPEHALPFGTGKAWMVVIPVDDDTTITYPVGTRIFIDQIQTPTQTLYTFVFGEDAYGDIVVNDDQPNAQPEEVDCLQAYNDFMMKETTNDN